MKKHIIIFSALLMVVSLSPAQTWQEKLEMMEKRVKNKLDEQRLRVERQYAEQMRRVWMEASLLEGMAPPPEPKPVDPSFFDPAKGMPAQAEIILAPVPDEKPLPPREEEPVEVAPDPAPRAKAPNLRPASSDMADGIARLDKKLSANFFGRDLILRYDSRALFEPMDYVNENHIADLWLKMDQSSHEMLLYQLQRYAEHMQLNDWGYCQLVNRAAKHIYPHSKNSRVIFNWFHLSKSGYIATVAYSRDRLYLMMPSEHVLYGKTYLKGENGLKYYVFDLDGTDPDLARVRVYDNKYPEASRKLDFAISRAPALAERIETRNLKFSYKGNDYSFPVKINKYLMGFYSSYPFMDLNVYMGAPLSQAARNSLIPSLRAATKNMSEQEAANFLLRFVQTAFEYKTDREQFGKERYLFAEETLFYRYSDCEDRSVLFAYLVREVIGLEAIGLVFPGHAATAVSFGEDVKGDHIRYRGKKYIICDPTYINAELGMVLPAYKNKEAKVVRF